MTKRTLKVSYVLLSLLLVVSLLASLLVTLAFAEDEATAQTRVYDSAADRMLDNANSSGARAAYRSISWEAGKCDDIEDPIIKMASPKISAGFDTLLIRLRSPDASIKLADLKFIVRVSDNLQLDPIALNDDIITGGLSLSSGTEIGADWVDLKIDFTQTEIKVSGKAISTTTPDAMVGFHLISDATKGGKLDIEKVSVYSSAVETVVINFDNVNETWWCNGDAGTFADMPRCYEIKEAKEIKSEDATANNVDEKYDAIVLGIAGSGTVTVAPIGEDGTVGTAKAWSELKDLAGVSVAALDGTFRNAVISLESLGQKKIQGVKIAVTDGTVLVSTAFFSNVVTEVPDKYFPILDASSIKYLSQFNFEYLTAGSDYDKAVTDCAGFNLDYILSYSAKNNVITDGHLVLDAQGEAYTSIKIRSKVASEGRKYLVVKYVLQDGATLNDFRFSVISTENDTASAIVYANQMVAGKLLPSLSDANPYSDGAYKYLIVDLEKSFGETKISGVDLYISGAGKVLVDEIFYADACSPKMDAESKTVFDDYEKPLAESGYWWTDISSADAVSVEEGALKINVAASTSVCVGGAKPTNNKDANHKYMVIRMKADNLDMSTFRIAWLDDTTSYANANGFVTADGKEFVLSNEWQDFVIDLDASGISRSIEGYRLWLGGWNAEAGTLYIDEVYFCDAVVKSQKAYSASVEMKANDNGYNYVCGGDYADADNARYMEISLSALNTFNFDGLRFEIKTGETSTFLWVSNGIKLADGTAMKLADPVVLEEGKDAEELTQKFVIDLSAIGIDGTEITQFHAHMNKVNVDSAVKIGVRYFDYVPALRSVVLPTNDDTKPVLTASVSVDNVVTGNEVSISATATDNYPEDISIKYIVTVGDKPVEVIGKRFVANQAGTYSVKVVATDKAGNSTEKVFTVVATAPIHECEHKCDQCGKCTDDCTDPVCADKCQGHKKGCAGVVTVSSIALFTLIAGAVVVCTKRKK